MRFTLQMRPLWPIEREVLEIIAAAYPASAEVLCQQIETAQVVSFENSGAGFFSNLAVAPDAPLLAEKSPLSAAHGEVLGIEHGMGFVVFLEDGRISVIEAYSYGDVFTGDLDFSQARYELRPFGSS
jgi:hypothetical protein